MKFTKIALSTIGALALLASTSALAGTLTVNGQGWFVPEATAQNVPLNTGGLGAANFTFNAPGLNFSAASPNYSVLDFLNSGSATNIVYISGPSLNSPMDDGTTGTIFEFTGTAFFVNGQTYTINHDDGVNAYVGGVLVVNAPGPTGAVPSPFIYTGATGNQSFDFIYGECCGSPAVFNANLVAPTPEPGSMLLFGTGLLGLAGAARRKFNR